MKKLLVLVFKCHEGKDHDWIGNFRLEYGAIEGNGSCARCGINIHQAYKAIYKESTPSTKVPFP
jgi:hypothetical protein